MRPTFASAPVEVEARGEPLVAERVDDVGVLAQHVEERPALLPRAHRVRAAPSRYASSRVMPDSTSASSTGWLNTSPYDASRFSSMRSG